MKKSRGFIGLPILLAIIIGTVVIGGGGYIGAKEYRKHQEQAKSGAARRTQEPPQAGTTTDSQPEAVIATTTAVALNALEGDNAVQPTPELAEIVQRTGTTKRLSVPPPTSTAVPTKATTTVKTSTAAIASTSTFPFVNFRVVPTDTSAAITFRTSVPATARITWTDGAIGAVENSPTGQTTSHAFDLGELKQRTTYNYAVEVVTDSGSTHRQSGTFTTDKTAGSLTFSVTPIGSGLVVGGGKERIARFWLSARNEPYVIKSLTLTATGTSVITGHVVEVAGVEVARKPTGGREVAFSDLTIAVATNTQAVIDVYALIAPITAVDSGKSAAVTLTQVGYVDSHGVPGSLPVNLTRRIYAVKAMPELDGTFFFSSDPLSIAATGTNSVYVKKIVFSLRGSSEAAPSNFTLRGYFHGGGIDFNRFARTKPTFVAVANCSSSGADRITCLCAGAGTELQVGSTLTIDASPFSAMTTSTFSSPFMSSGTAFESYASPEQVPESATLVWSDGSGKWYSDALVTGIRTR